jgi:hypothetical protein
MRTLRSLCARGPFSSAFNLFLTIFNLFCVDSLLAQNIVESTTAEFTANPVGLTDMDVSEFFGKVPAYGGQQRTEKPTPDLLRVRRELEAEVDAFVAGAPWRPFHHTLGISGYETEFAHPDEVFLVLSLVLPWLAGERAERVKDWLKFELVAHPPFGQAGYFFRDGRARERYEVPAALLPAGQAKAASALGLYSFWQYVQATGEREALISRWTEVTNRAAPLLEMTYEFDLERKPSARGEPERLNGDLAGLLGLARMARLRGDALLERRARARGRELLELRVNLERVSPKLLEHSKAASKRLHNVHLARFNLLVPEVAQAVAHGSADCAVRNLRVFREERNGWFMAFGDRLIGGENYTNPLSLPRAQFVGAALIERLPSETLAGFLDVPWCAADLSWLEKAVWVLWTAAGQPWTTLDELPRAAPSAASP